MRSMGGDPTGDWSQDFENFVQLCEEKKQSVTINASIVPPKNEYQNFGIVAALDVVNAIKDAVERYGINPNNIIFNWLVVWRLYCKIW